MVLKRSQSNEVTTSNERLTEVGAIDSPVGKIGKRDLVTGTFVDDVYLRIRLGLWRLWNVLVVVGTLHDLCATDGKESGKSKCCNQTKMFEGSMGNHFCKESTKGYEEEGGLQILDGSRSLLCVPDITASHFMLQGEHAWRHCDMTP